MFSLHYTHKQELERLTLLLTRCFMLTYGYVSICVCEQHLQQQQQLIFECYLWILPERLTARELLSRTTLLPR